MTSGVVPISDDERRARIAKAQRLMEEEKLDAIFLEGTAACFYFANMRWGQSERTFGVVIPAQGELAYVCPGFEENRARELITFGTDVRVMSERYPSQPVPPSIMTTSPSLRDCGVRLPWGNAV